MIKKKHGKQNSKKVWNLQKAFSLHTIKVCRFEIIDGVKNVYCIKHPYKFLLREQVELAAVLVSFLYSVRKTYTVRLIEFSFVQPH